MSGKVSINAVLLQMEQRHRRIENVFTGGLVISMILAIVLPMFEIPDSRLSTVMFALFLCFLSFLFCRGRAASCANSVAFSLHLESKDATASIELLKSSDCLKNADALIESLTKFVANRKPG